MKMSDYSETRVIFLTKADDQHYSCAEIPDFKPCANGVEKILGLEVMPIGSRLSIALELLKTEPPPPCKLCGK